MARASFCAVFSDKCSCRLDFSPYLEKDTEALVRVLRDMVQFDNLRPSVAP